MTLEVQAGAWQFDGVDLAALAARIGTPTYVYSANAIRQRIDTLKAALHGLDARICYAVKANPNLAVLQLMAQAGLGADIVSIGELHRALRAGIPACRIVFSGVGKTEREIVEALGLGVWKFNVESRDELHLLCRVSSHAGVMASTALRINPDIDALTHAKISTGRAQNKFGVGLDEARQCFADAAECAFVRLDGLHTHIGSQILQLGPFRDALARIEALRCELVAAGYPIRSVDVGGGLGVRYRTGDGAPIPVPAYVALIREVFACFDGTLVFEPGRHLVADAGLLLSRIIRIKPGAERPFLVLDAGINDLLRPALYDAWHEIVPLHGRESSMRYDIVGPVCETGDTFALDRAVPMCEAGDLVAILGAGAYGASMASTYNSRPLPAEVLVDAGRHAIVRERQDFEAMIAGERPMASWLTLPEQTP